MLVCLMNEGMNFVETLYTLLEVVMEMFMGMSSPTRMLHPCCWLLSQTLEGLEMSAGTCTGYTLMDSSWLDCEVPLS